MKRIIAALVIVILGIGVFGFTVPLKSKNYYYTDCDEVNLSVRTSYNLLEKKDFEQAPVDYQCNGLKTNVDHATAAHHSIKLYLLKTDIGVSL